MVYVCGVGMCVCSVGVYVCVLLLFVCLFAVFAVFAVGCEVYGYNRLFFVHVLKF